MSTKVAIIGTAGRQGLDKQLSKDVFIKMTEKARHIILDEWKLDPNTIELVSGGAAWSDHIAVHLFLYKEFRNLSLHFPTKWNRETKLFDYNNKTGQAANHYHHLFSESTGWDTFAELDEAIEEGAKVNDSYTGFFERNNVVAKEAQYMIAFTLDDGDEPSRQSGTHYTWSRCHTQPWKKRHVCILTL